MIIPEENLEIFIRGVNAGRRYLSGCNLSSKEVALVFCDYIKTSKQLSQILEFVKKFDGLEGFINITKNKAVGKEEYAYYLLQEILKVVNHG